VNQRGEYGHRQRDLRSNGDRVGISLFHTVGDRERAIEQISTGFRQLSDEIMTKAGHRSVPYREASGPLWEWWRLAGVPVIEEWQKFQADQMGSWSTRWATSWESYEGWQSRLKKLRDLAESKVREFGQRLETSASPDLPKTLPGAVLEAGGRAAEKAGEAVWETGKIIKWAAIGVLTFGGIFALSSLAMTLKKGEEPLEYYTRRR